MTKITLEDVLITRMCSSTWFVLNRAVSWHSLHAQCSLHAGTDHSFILIAQFSSVLSDSLRLYGLHHTRPPCPSPTPRVYSNSCPLSQWCHPTISSSVVPFSRCRGPAPVDPGNSKGGWRWREKNLFIDWYKIRLRNNSVVGRLSGKRGLNSLVYTEDQ